MLGEMAYWAELRGVRLYYEVHGAGPPLLLLHGSLGGTWMWRRQVPALAERYRVFVPDQRGRSRSPDVPGPLSYQLLMEDMAEFIESVIGTAAHVVGASDGGIVALFLALRRAELVRKIVAIGANYHHSAIVAGSGWLELGPDDPAWDAPRARYADMSPDGADHWPVIFGKLQRMATTEPALAVEELRPIKAPFLVMSGDDDAIDLHHTISLYENLTDAQLAVLPGTSHVVFLEKPETVNEMILEFLAAEGPPQTILPVRRAARRDSAGSAQAS
jgi:pimeloyl-ACP methyl ester carboxylesterase